MQTIKDTLKTILVSSIILFLISVAYAWTEPFSNPPADNVSAPINTSLTTQLKLGAFGVNGVFTANSTAIFNSSVCIGGDCRTSWPSGGTTPPPPPPPSAPTVSLSASPISVTSGGSSTLTWSSTNATGCTASGSWSGAKATSGSQSTGVLTSNQTYSLYCTGAGGNSGTASASVTVTVPLPTVSLSIGQSYAQDGVIPTNYFPNRALWTNDYPITLRWTTSNAVSCVASGSWSGGKTLSGTETFYPSAAVAYTLSCSNTTGTTNKTVTIPTVKQWQDVSGQGNLNETCRAWLARTRQAGVDGSEPIAPQRYQDHGYGECWYRYSGPFVSYTTQDADLVLTDTYTDPDTGILVVEQGYPIIGIQEKSNFYTQTRR